MFEIKRDVKYSNIKEKKFFIYNVGSGGTRYHVATQTLRTAGFIIKHNSSVMYVDPGIGALVTSIEKEIKIEDIDLIFLSHTHIDHSGDVLGIIESKWIKTLYKRKVSLISPQSFIEKYISSYYRKMLSNSISLSLEKKIILKEFTITPTPTIHHEKENYGFILDTGSLKIGYTSDTVFFNNFGTFYKDVDVLITHLVVKEKTKESEKRHASVKDIIDMINSTNPKYVLLRHIGYEILQAGLSSILAYISSQLEKDTVVEFLLDGDCVILRS